MKFSNRNIIINALLIIILLLTFVSFPCNIENMENNIEISPIEIVVSRYNEDLRWLDESPFSNHPIVCYNKGANETFNKPKNMKKIVKVKNVGRCDHTYLYHIVSNYDNLADVTIFLPGSTNMPGKMEKAKKQILEVEQHKNTVFIGTHHPNGVKDTHKDFYLDDWAASDNANKEINPEASLKKAEPRPFINWYQKHFKDIHVEYTSYLGILGVSREHIIQHPKSYYENLLKELDDHSNPEVGHYFERAWAAVFYPMHNAKFITY